MSEIGELAGIKVDIDRRGNEEVVKFASAHDLRRSFGTPWASKVKPATLQLLMRQFDDRHDASVLGRPRRGRRGE